MKWKNAMTALAEFRGGLTVFLKYSGGFTVFCFPLGPSHRTLKYLFSGVQLKY